MCALVVTSLATACTARAPSAPELGVTRVPVVGGEASPAGGLEDAVLLMRTIVDNGEIVCTASLVAPNLVITARHCVSYLEPGNFSCTPQGGLVSADPGAGILGMHFDASGLEFYDGKTPRQDPIAHGAQILSTLSDTICTNDLAFVVLDRDVALPVLPLREHGRALPGEAVTLVGYGFDDAMSTGDVLDVTTQPRTHNDRLTIADVGPASDDVGSAPPRTIVVQGPSGCIGDSGGPLIARSTGAVLGIYSLLDASTCLALNAKNLFTHVPDFGVLANDAFTAAGAKPTPESSGSEPGGPGAGQAGASGNRAENGEGGASAGAPNVSNGGAAGDSETTGSTTGGSETSEGGAPSPPSDLAGQGGAPSSNASGGAPASGSGNATSPATSAARSSHHGGCAVTPGDARMPAVAWLFGLVAVLERVFRVRARIRGRRRLHDVLRC